MWLLHDIGYCILGVIIWALIVWPTSFAWSEYWHARQKRMREADPEHARRYWRESDLFDLVDLLIIVLGVPLAFILTLLCRDWWGS